jgi:hypothetical protein
MPADVAPVDVLIPTKGDTPRLMEAVSAVRGCLPVNSVFRADGGTLGEARQRLIEASTTERVFMLDSDVVLSPGPWLGRAMRLLDDGASCVVLQPPLAVGPLQRFVSFYWRVRPPMQGLFFGTMATFFTKASLKGIRIPKELSGAEDLYILLHLMRQKKRIEVIQVPGLHHHSPSADKGAWVGSSLRVLQGLVGFRAVLSIVVRNVLLYLPAVAFASLLTLDAEMMRYGLALWKRYAKGYFGR